MLPTCESLPIIQYQPMPVQWLQDFSGKDLSSDQQYLLDMCHAVSSGECSVGLANRSPGKVHHARWLTTANRLLRLYVSTSDPSENLRCLVHYVMNVYARTWFSIRCRPSCAEGPKHLFGIMSFSRCMNAESKKKKKCGQSRSEQCLVCPP